MTEISKIIMHYIDSVPKFNFINFSLDLYSNDIFFSEESDVSEIPAVIWSRLV